MEALAAQEAQHDLTGTAYRPGVCVARGPAWLLFDGRVAHVWEMLSGGRPDMAARQARGLIFRPPSFSKDISAEPTFPTSSNFLYGQARPVRPMRMSRLRLKAWAHADSHFLNARRAYSLTCGASLLVQIAKCLALPQH